MDQVTSRRAFARYLAASPLLAALGAAACAERQEEAENEDAEDAREWYEFNILGAWMGDTTPVFVRGLSAHADAS